MSFCIVEKKKRIWKPDAFITSNRTRNNHESNGPKNIKNHAKVSNEPPNKKGWLTSYQPPNLEGFVLLSSDACAYAFIVRFCAKQNKKN